MEENVLHEIVDALEENPQMWEMIRQLDAGVGTYEQAEGIAEILGDEIARQLATRYSPEQLEAYARAGHDIVSMVSETAQQNLNDAAQIGLKPMTTKYPKARVEALATELAAVDAENIPKEIKDSIPSFLMEMVGDTVLECIGTNPFNEFFVTRPGVSFQEEPEGMSLRKATKSI